MLDLLYEPFTMGLEKPQLVNMGVSGLVRTHPPHNATAHEQNGVIIAEPNAAFFDKWLMGYQDFRQQYEYNSVLKSLVSCRSNQSTLACSRLIE
jgi:hypothetical protein